MAPPVPMPPEDPLFSEPDMLEELEFVVVEEVEDVEEEEEEAMLVVALDATLSDCQLSCIRGAYTVMTGMTTAVANVVIDASVVVVATTVTVPGTVKRA